MVSAAGGDRQGPGVVRDVVVGIGDAGGLDRVVADPAAGRRRAQGELGLQGGEVAADRAGDRRGEGRIGGAVDGRLVVGGDVQRGRRDHQGPGGIGDRVVGIDGPGGIDGVAADRAAGRDGGQGGQGRQARGRVAVDEAVVRRGEGRVRCAVGRGLIIGRDGQRCRGDLEGTGPRGWRRRSRCRRPATPGPRPCRRR